MTFVEHSREYPLLTWGANIQVEPSGSGLTVSAIEPISDEQQEAAPDLFRAYRCAISRFGGAKRQGTNSPHIEFANADTDQKLTQFIQRFGPVLVSSLRQEDHPVHSDDFFDFPMSQTVRFAEQDLSELRNEQQLYRAALALVADLEQGIEADVQTVQDCICTIAEKASYWPAQWRREQQLRMSGQGYEQQALWHFEQDNLRHLDIWKSMAIHPRQTLGQRLAKV